MVRQALGASGSQQVPSASGTALPRGAINNLLMQLLASASESLPESDLISEQSYLRGESDEYLIDPASPEQQAAMVLAHLQPAGTATYRSGSGEFMETAEWMVEDFSASELDEWMESEDSTEIVRFY